MNYAILFTLLVAFAAPAHAGFGGSRSGSSSFGGSRSSSFGGSRSSYSGSRSSSSSFGGSRSNSYSGSRSTSSTSSSSSSSGTRSSWFGGSRSSASPATVTRPTAPAEVPGTRSTTHSAFSNTSVSREYHHYHDSGPSMWTYFMFWDLASRPRYQPQPVIINNQQPGAAPATTTVVDSGAGAQGVVQSGQVAQQPYAQPAQEESHFWQILGAILLWGVIFGVVGYAGFYYYTTYWRK